MQRPALQKMLIIVASAALFLITLPRPGFAFPLLPEATVTRVVDGDTVALDMNTRTFRARLIGIDAPEMGQEPWGRKAKKHLREILKASGGKVRVETDVTKYDKYDRLLAYLWLDDKTLVNELMVRDGFAVLFTIQPNNRYADRLRKAQDAAKENHAGIWGQNGLTEKPIEYKKNHPRK